MLNFLLDAAKTSFLTDALRNGLSPVLHFTISKPILASGSHSHSFKNLGFPYFVHLGQESCPQPEPDACIPSLWDQISQMLPAFLDCPALPSQSPSHSVCLAGLHYCRNSLRKCKDDISSIFPMSIVLHIKSPQSVCQIRFYYVEKKYNLAVKGITSRVCLLGFKSQLFHLLAI